MRQKGRRKTNGVAHPTKASEGAVESISELESIVEACRRVLQNTTLYRELHNVLVDDVDVEPPPEILCFGVGNFSKTQAAYFSASLWQVTCLLQLRDDLQRENDNVEVWFYDPVTTPLEKEFLQRHRIDVLETNEHGRRKLPRGAWAFLPHCPAVLYEHLWQSNPHAFLDDTSFWIGNSIRNFCDALTLEVDIPTLRARVDDLDERCLTVDDDDDCDGRDLPGDFEKAFNDTYIIRGKKRASKRDTTQAA